MSDSMKFLSIIIPIYNMEKYLPECLTSLYRQNFGKEVEILLLDDGSTDSSGEFCDKIARADTHFRVFHYENRGVAATRNRGLDEARGKYIAWVDPDDYITDDWWQVINPVLEKNPDMIMFDYRMLSGGKFSFVHYDATSRIIERDELIQELVKGTNIQSHLWSKIFRRTLFEQPVRFDESRTYCEDYQALHKITFPVQKCVYLHNALYVYRMQAASIVHDKSMYLANQWLYVELNIERKKFYQAQNINVSNFGVQYAKLQFCIAYHIDKMAHSKQMQKHYQDSLQDLKRTPMLLFKSDVSIKKKIHLFLLLSHLYFIVPALRKLK